APCALVERLRLLPAATRWLWLDEPALAAVACTADAGHGRDRRPACAVRQRSYPGKPHSRRAPGEHRRRPSVSRHQRKRIRSNDFRIFALTMSLYPKADKRETSSNVRFGEKPTYAVQQNVRSRFLGLREK